MKNKNPTKNAASCNERRDFVALAAKVRKAGAMQDRRKKRTKERTNAFEGWV
jgi:hypothetical protein